MQILAVVLVTISAIIHAGWNFFSQQRGVTTGFFFLSCLAAALVLSPLLWLYREGMAALPPFFWLCVVLSGLFEALYYQGLCGAYRSGDLSATYPLVRAAPVVLVALISLVFGGNRAPQGVGLVGVWLVAAGCLMLPLSSFRRPDLRSYFLPASLLALTAGIGTTGYSLADDQAIRHLTHIPTEIMPVNMRALFFLTLKTLSSTTALGILLVIFPKDRARIRQTWRNDLKVAMLTGLVIFGAYGMVLAAMILAENVSYVVAFRQLSIPIGALLGFLVNREPLIPTRIAGVGIITLGVLLIAFG